MSNAARRQQLRDLFLSCSSIAVAIVSWALGIGRLYFLRFRPTAASGAAASQIVIVTSIAVG